ncbi:hypothetical protein [Sphingomonas sp.]|uniref:hypothetical protein n=1 Tax=Sphingomonas sp. TaxID=28214 RepID=UPI0035B43406
MTIYRAAELFTLQTVPAVEGKPAWMNLRARRRPQWLGEPPALTGPGIYGMFLDDRLAYVGIYAGHAQRPFGGSVLDRWHKHVVYQTLRAPEVAFAASQLSRILNALDGPAIAEIGACPEDEPLIGRHGGSCTFEKARFAVRHWDVFGPGNEAGMLDRLSFVYHRLDPSWADEVPAGGECDASCPSGWVKRNWLHEPERLLIAALQPPCNSRTHGRPCDIGPDELLSRIAAIVNAPPADAVAAPPPAPTPSKPQSAENSLMTHDDEETPGEAAFRAKLGDVAEAMLDELHARCPSAMQIGFTNIPDLRIYMGRRVLVTLSPRTKGGLPCETYAPVSVCRAFGFDASPKHGQMTARFTFLPDQHDIGDLLAVAGAAAAAIAA